MNMKKIAAGVTLAALLALPGLSTGASAPSVKFTGPAAGICGSRT